MTPQSAIAAGARYRALSSLITSAVDSKTNPSLDWLNEASSIYADFVSSSKALAGTPEGILLGQNFLGIGTVPTGQRTEADDACHLVGLKLNQAVATYNVAGSQYNQSAADWNERIERMAAKIHNEKTMLVLGDVARYTSAISSLLFVIADTLATFLPEQAHQVYEGYAKVRDMREIALGIQETSIEDGKVVVKEDTQIDIFQYAINESIKGKLVEFGNIFEDLLQGLNGLNNAIETHSKILAAIDELEAQFRKFAHMDRTRVEENLSDAYDKVNDLFIKYYGYCVSKASYENGKITTPFSPPTSGTTPPIIDAVIGAPATSSGAPALGSFDATLKPLPASVPALGVLDVELSDLHGNFVAGSQNADVISKTTDDNFVLGGDGNDLITLLGKGNIAFGGAGNDIIDFGAKGPNQLFTVAGFAGNARDYTVTTAGEWMTVTDKVTARDDIDLVRGASMLRFADGRLIIGSSTFIADMLPIPTTASQSTTIIPTTTTPIGIQTNPTTGGLVISNPF